MEIKILRSLAMKSIGLMLSVFFVSILLTKYNDMTSYANDINYNQEISTRESMFLHGQNVSSIEELSVQMSSYRKQEILASDEQRMEDILGDKYIRIKKEDSKTLAISVDDLYLEHCIAVKISGLTNKGLSTGSVEGIQSGLLDLNDIIKDVNLKYSFDANNTTYTAIYHIELDSVYVYKVYEDEDYVYIDLLDPHQVYDRIIVVDAGHGGTDVGTHTPDMKYLEKDINLDIVLKLKEMLDKENIKVYYTRTTDEKVYLNPRVNLANNLKADFFISVHCNSNVDESPNGTAALYGKTHKTDQISSKELASICVGRVVDNAGTKNMGLVYGQDIVIVKKAKVPVSLIEVAFMSNKKDMSYLSKEKNREHIAAGIYDGIMNAYKELED